MSKSIARVFLFTAFSLLCLAAKPALAAESAGPTTGALQGEKVKLSVLFVSWDNLFKGRNEPLIDVAHASPDGWKAIEGLEKSWNRKFQTNGPGMKMFLAPHNIHITLEKARKEPMLLVADRPWEAKLDNMTVTILHEGGKLRCWYGVLLPEMKQELNFQQGRQVETGGKALCYAESTDGLTWTKPNLGVLSFNGSTENNMVTFANVYSSLFHDRQGAPDEQYKTAEFSKLPAEELARNKGGDFNSFCLYAMVSPDGYHWRTLTNNPIVRHFCDTQNIVAWDPQLKKYVGYFRDHQAGRAISRGETDDFHNWPPTQPLLVPGPEDAVDEEYYSNTYTTYPGDSSLHLLFPSIFHDVSDRVDVRLAVSREGRAYSWVSHEPIVELGKPGEWDGGQIYCSPDLVRLADGKLRLAYQASPRTHNEGFMTGFYPHFNMSIKSGWAVWDDGRLAGIQSDGEGEFYTQPLRPEGERLEINARTAPGGGVKVELCQDGLPIEGYSLADNLAFQGDSIWVPVQWKNKTDISDLRGKKLQVHFTLTNAKIFGYRIASHP